MDKSITNDLRWCPTCEEYVSKDTALSCADTHCEMVDEFFGEDMAEYHSDSDPVVPLNFHHMEGYGMMDYLNDTIETEEEEVEDE